MLESQIKPLQIEGFTHIKKNIFTNDCCIFLGIDAKFKENVLNVL